MDNSIQDKLTSRLKNVLSTAAKTSQENKAIQIGTEHILYGMMQETGSLSYSILKKFGFTPEFIKTEMDQMPKTGQWKEELSKHARQVFEKAARTAFQYHHRYIGTEHVLFGILSVKDCMAYKLLEKSPVDVKALNQQVQIVLKSTSHFPDLSNFLGMPNALPPTESASSVKKAQMSHSGLAEGMPGVGGKQKTPAIDFFTQDLTAAAQEHKFDPIIGRTKEIDRMMSILNRKNKNNPILIGEPGTGKTAIVSGLAQRIINGDVPPKLQGRRILALDMASLIAGTTFRGEFEERVKELTRELEQNKESILFIDEIHTIVGAGAAGGSMDAANMLKPVLARGDLSIIGATTLDEYRKHIEKDAALERRFQPIHINEPSDEEAVSILQGVREVYEQHHGLTVTDEAIEAAVEMSVRYIMDRFLPDKAFDLLDEAAATLQLKIAGSKEAKEAHILKQQMEQLREKKEEAIEAENYEDALQAKRKEDALAEKLASIARKASADEEGTRPAIIAEDIARVVAESTGIPVTRLLKNETEKLEHLEDILHKYIVGQNEAINALSRYVRRSRAGISNPNRPLGSFIFLGPTGVGKTETAKVLAREVFENEDALVRVDMSEFMEGHSVSRLIGAPAGYVGYEEGGKLTEKIRRQPYSIVLFDEIEKAHRDVLNILLQILDEGQLTDAHGRSVSFRNTIVILTSNIGSEQLAQQARMGFNLPQESVAREAAETRYDEMKDTVLRELRGHLSPELLGRIDKTVVFSPLTQQNLVRVAELHIHELADRLMERDIHLDVSKGVLEEIATRAAARDEGARAIRNVVQELIEDEIANSVINDEIKEGQSILARKTGGKVKVTTNEVASTSKHKHSA